MATRHAHIRQWIHAQSQAQATDAIIALGAHLRDERLRYVPARTGPEPQAPDWEMIDPLADEEAHHG